MKKINEQPLSPKAAYYAKKGASERMAKMREEIVYCDLLRKVSIDGKPEGRETIVGGVDIEWGRDEERPEITKYVAWRHGKHICLASTTTESHDTEEMLLRSMAAALAMHCIPFSKDF